MPTGIYLRTEKHRAINKGRKFPNRKRYSKGITPINKICLFCKKEFITNCFMPRKKYCSISCRAKNNLELNLLKLTKGRVNQKEMMLNKKGELHPRWIKDRTKLKDDHRDRGGQLSRNWSISVKNRDGRKCKINNKDCNGKLESHHILSWKDFPELRYDINNGITLCHYHHPKRKEEAEKLITIFKDIIKTS